MASYKDCIPCISFVYSWILHKSKSNQYNKQVEFWPEPKKTMAYSHAHATHFWIAQVYPCCRKKPPSLSSTMGAVRNESSWFLFPEWCFDVFCSWVIFSSQKFSVPTQFTIFPSRNCAFPFKFYVPTLWGFFIAWWFSLMTFTAVFFRPREEWHIVAYSTVVVLGISFPIDLLVDVFGSEIFWVSVLIKLPPSHGHTPQQTRKRTTRRTNTSTSLSHKNKTNKNN